MRIKNIKICKRALMFLVAGTVSITSSGCSTFKEENKTNEIEAKNTSASNTKVEEVTSTEIPVVEDNIKEYKDNTYGYLKKAVYLKEDNDKNSKKIKKVDQYQKVKLIEKEDNWDLVKFGNKKGYIKDNNITILKGEYIEVDISKQKLKYFNKNGKVIVKTDVVTGFDKQRDTILGAYKIYSKEYDRLLRGANYTSHVDYWMPFYGGYGLHDADWRSSFGGNIYKYSGSHGCVNIPDAKAKKIYQKSKVGTKVLIHR